MEFLDCCADFVTVWREPTYYGKEAIVISPVHGESGSPKHGSRRYSISRDAVPGDGDIRFGII